MKQLLDRIGWSQAEFARRVRLSQTTVSQWCRNGPDTPMYRLAMLYLECLAKAMGK